jgi:hypothetical protein
LDNLVPPLDLPALGMSENILLSRKHKVLTARTSALQTNLLAYHGGAPYIDTRLSRFPAESDTDFIGDQATGAIGRKERAFLKNYARRVAHKVSQYVFSQPISRDGLDETFATDVTRTGMSLDQFMFELIAHLIVCRWCWIGIDRPAATPGRSVLDRERAGDRVYWKLYTPLEVVDWAFVNGKLAWVLTEEDEYTNDNPRLEATEKKVRFLYEPGQTTRIEQNKEGGAHETPTTHSLRDVAFVPVGLISSAVWWYDDVERIQRAILDKQSALDTAIFKAVFPLLVAPASLAEQAKMDGSSSAEARRKIGIGNPIIESAEESGITRWLQGVTSDLKFIREEIAADANELMEVVGLNMSVPESRQVSSAEAKQWDHLDVEAVLANYAAVAEEAEKKAVEISVAMGGGTFKGWEPKYTRKFDIRNFASDMEAITQAAALPLPPEAEKLLLRAAVRSLASEFGADDAERKKALDAVDSYDPAAELRKVTNADYVPSTEPGGGTPEA